MMNNAPKSREGRANKVNTLPAEQQQALGALAAQTEVRWQPVNRGLHKLLPHIYLGATPGGFVDSIDTTVPEAGFVFINAQLVNGWTGIRARPLFNCAVQAARIDHSSGTLTWVNAPRHSKEVMVAEDAGRILEVPSHEWTTTNLGNPGVRAGLIRVINEHNDVNYYALTADFQGEHDEWGVASSITEVRFER